MKYLKRTGILIIISALALIISCAMEKECGTLSLNIYYEKSLEKLTLPDIDLSIDHYNITLTGPDNELLSYVNTTGDLIVDNLATGSWSINAIAINSGDLPVGTGNNSAEIIAQQTTNCEVLVIPFDGYGGLSLTVSWDTGIVETASITGTLDPAAASLETIDFTISNGLNVYENPSLVCGYYILSVKLMNNGTECGGAVDVIRIITDEITNTEIFVQAMNPSGSAGITIIPMMNEPIDITLSGGQAVINQGSDFTMSADPSVTSNVIYTWYIDGVEKSSGANAAEYTIPNDLEKGIHRLDVTVFTNDGLRGGSETFTFEVI